jgi:hypothetical protein
MNITRMASNHHRQAGNFPVIVHDSSSICCISRRRRERRVNRRQWRCCNWLRNLRYPPGSLGKARCRSEARSQNNGPRDRPGNFAPKEIALCVVRLSIFRILIPYILNG